jgi:hypothetical protein
MKDQGRTLEAQPRATDHGPSRNHPIGFFGAQNLRALIGIGPLPCLRSFDPYDSSSQSNKSLKTLFPTPSLQ